MKYRDKYCGEVTAKDVGKEVVLCGWVREVRDLGGVVFVLLADREGEVQVVAEGESGVVEVAQNLGREFVIRVEGTVRRRPKEAVNPNMKTGEVEVVARKIEVLNSSDTPPIYVRDDVEQTEEVRLRYRYLDLRRPVMLKRLWLRHRIALETRKYLDSLGFWEVETPFLTKSTPEGARDYLVPSRVNPGKFYALPQSPQLFKQILMVASVDRYFQIVRCFRDEDLRADRQPEFTQIDIEMSFVTKEDVIRVVEGLFAHLTREVLGKEIEVPFPRVSFDEAMRKYGTDKPDLRIPWEIREATDVFRDFGMNIVRSLVEKGAKVALLPVREFSPSRKEAKSLEEVVKKAGAGGLLWFVAEGEQIRGPFAKFLTEDQAKSIKEAVGGKGCAFAVVGEGYVPFEALGELRTFLGEKLLSLDPFDFRFLWVVDFPLFEWNEEEQRLDPRHHPFTKPVDADIPLLDTDPLKVRAEAYDIILNGYEIGGGSIRINNTELQRKIFKLIGIPDEVARERFGFLLDALKYGAPPHGGIALGFDRIVMLFAGARNLREVIPFPKTKRAQDLMTGAPAEVDPSQLEELHIEVRRKGG